MAKNYDYEAYKRKYVTKHKTYCFNLEIDRDRDLIALLENKENRSSFIRELLRRAVQNEVD